MLNNSADIFDWADTIPGSLLPQIKAKATGRFKQVNLGGSMYYFFLNATQKPFNSQLAREAVVTGPEPERDVRLGSGTLAPGLLLPAAGRVRATRATASARTAHPATGNLAKAKQLVKQSGHGRHAGHGLERGALAAPAVDDVLHPVPEPDRLQGHAEGDRGRDLLHDDRRT